MSELLYFDSTIQDSLLKHFNLNNLNYYVSKIKKSKISQFKTSVSANYTFTLITYFFQNYNFI